MQFDLVIKNGLVILDGGETITDIAVQDGVIAGIGTGFEGKHRYD